MIERDYMGYNEILWHIENDGGDDYHPFMNPYVGSPVVTMVVSILSRGQAY